MKTISIKPSEVTRKWFTVDASDITLGRLASETAKLLIGKGKTTYTPHVDGGDYVIVVNAKNLKTSGDKLEAKKYYRHSGHPGNLRTKTLGQKIESNPAEVIELAVRGMIPDNKLRATRMSRLKVYAETEHNHNAQSPETIDLKGNK